MHIPELTRKHRAALDEVIVILMRAYATKDWSDVATADTFLDRLEVEVLQYDEDDAEDMKKIQHDIEEGAGGHDWTKVAVSIQHLCAVSGRAYPIKELSKKEAAIYLALTQQGIRKAVEAGKLAEKRIGSIQLFAIKDLDQYRREIKGRVFGMEKTYEKSD